MTLSVFFLCLTGRGIASAAVQPVVLFINSFITNYTVPAGKVLLIEHLSAWAANNTPTTPRIIIETKILNIGNGGILTTDWGFPVTDKYQDVTLLRPLRIPANGIVGINSAGNIAYNEIHIMGMLIDAGDLYAANVGGSVEEVKVAGGALSTTVDLTSPRPVRISSATSFDLVSWSANASEQKQRVANPPGWNVRTDVQGNEKFLKVAARTPESVPRVSP